MYVITYFLCVRLSFVVFFFKQKTAYEMRISDWSSDVCSADHLVIAALDDADLLRVEPARIALVVHRLVTREELGIEEQLGVEGGELGAPFGVDILDAVARLVRRLDSPHREDAVHRVAGEHHRDKIGRAHV